MNTALLFLTLIPPAAPTTPDPKLTELVRQLGHRDFKTRDAAARELLQAGGEALPVIRSGLNDADPEIAQRCKQLLPQIYANNRQEKLTRLLKDPTSPPPKGLAGLERFLDVTVDNKESRQLYAEMMKEHYGIIEALETDPATALRLMQEPCRNAVQGWEASHGLYEAGPLMEYDRANLTMVLFVRGDKRFSDKRSGGLGSYQLLRAVKTRRVLSGQEAIPAINKLFLAWMRVEKRTEFVYQSFVVVRDARFKEAVPEVLHFAADKNWPADSRADVLDIMVKIGDRKHVQELGTFLTDKSVIGTCNDGNGRMLDVQFRDVALGVSVLLSGQKMEEFGYHTAGLRDGIPVSSFGYGFADDKTRESAFAKWKEFASKPENKQRRDP